MLLRSMRSNWCSRFRLPVNSESRWDRSTVDIGVKDKGVYLVEAVTGELRAYTILIVSDIAMITKTGKGRLVNLVVNRATGQLVPGVDIALLARDQPLGSGETNGDGIAEMSFVAGHRDDVRLVAHHGADYAVNALAGNAFSASEESWTSYIYPDRPVYRSGHTVHFRGILRRGGDAGYETPAGREDAAPDMVRSSDSLLIIVPGCLARHQYCPASRVGQTIALCGLSLAGRRAGHIKRWPAPLRLRVV